MNNKKKIQCTKYFLIHKNGNKIKIQKQQNRYKPNKFLN